ncbi:unnamed protein product, partial [Didymodactylos carnosus]
IICILTIIHGLLCEIQRHPGDIIKLNKAFVHVWDILMKTKPKPFFNQYQYSIVIDFIIQTVFQHRILYETILSEKPLHQDIDEIRTIDHTLFTQKLLPSPLTEAIPLDVYNEIILKLPLVPAENIEDSTQIMNNINQDVVKQSNNEELEQLADNVAKQFKNVTRENVLKILNEVSGEFMKDLNQDMHEKLKQRERDILEKFKM